MTKQLNNPNWTEKNISDIFNKKVISETKMRLGRPIFHRECLGNEEEQREYHWLHLSFKPNIVIIEHYLNKN